MDVFIQDNFFPEPLEVALVYDPKAKEEGLFLWKRGKPDTDPFLLEEDAPVEAVTTTVKQAKEITPQSGMIGDVAEYVGRLEAIEKRQKIILVLLAIIGLIALA